MPGPMIMFPSLLAGVILAMWGRIRWTKAPRDPWLFFLGIVLGSVIAWTITDPWYALGFLVVAPLIVVRRKRAR